MNTHSTQARSRHRTLGVTLVESAMTLAIVAVIVSAAAPGFGQARDRRHLEGVAAQLETDIQHARSAAVARNESVRITFETQQDASCYVVHTGSAGDCHCASTGVAVCSAGAVALQTVRVDGGLPVRISSNSNSMLFDAIKGTVTPTATIRVQGREATIHKVVNIMGRVRSCSPAPVLSGYKPC